MIGSVWSHGACILKKHEVFTSQCSKMYLYYIGSFLHILQFVFDWTLKKKLDNCAAFVIIFLINFTHRNIIIIIYLIMIININIIIITTKIG